MKQLLTVTVAALISLCSIAQGKGKNAARQQEKKEFKEQKDDRKAEHFSEMSEKLNLTEEQKAQMKAANEDFKKQMKELKGNTGMAQDEMKAKRREIVKAHKEKIHSILTPEQQEQVKQMHKEHMGEHKGKMHDRMGMHDRMEALTEGLNLTADQSAKINSLQQTFKTNLDNLKQNTTLSQEQKRAEMMSLKTKFRQDVMAVLTDEQKEELKKRRQEHGGFRRGG